MQPQQPKTWSRETMWRQGNILSPEAVQHFGFANAIDEAATCVLVISHDCDLANDNLEVEPDVEVIVGRFVKNESGNFTWGKAPRTLHSSAKNDGAQVWIELVTTSKQAIPKNTLAQFAPERSCVLDGKALAVLRSWLGSRYNRAAFPDTFVNRMKELKADTKLAKVLEKQSELISFVYFDVDGGANVERKREDPYSLSIVLVYVCGDDATAAGDTAGKLAEKVEETIQARIKDHPTEIVLKSCFAISEDDLPVSQARVLNQWRLEYMTLKSDEEQSGPPLL